MLFYKLKKKADGGLKPPTQSQGLHFIIFIHCVN
jgi:hypothetical protein